MTYSYYHNCNNNFNNVIKMQKDRQVKCSDFENNTGGQICQSYKYAEQKFKDPRYFYQTA